MFGLSAGAGLRSARSLLRRVPAADRAELIEEVRNTLAGASMRLDHRVVTTEGDVRTLSLRGEAVSADGAPKYLQGSYQDITERRQVEVELEAARDEAQAANAAKTALLAGMSHELHTPLNAIIGFSELIAQQKLGPIAEPKYIEFADVIRRAGQRALTVFRDVLLMAELEAGRLRLKLEKIDLCRAAGLAVAEFRQTGAGAGHEISFETNGDGCFIHADEGAVEQMVLKLLSNAAKFSATGSTIRIAVAWAGAGSVRLDVVDTGIGMTADEAELAVRPFGKADGGLARSYEGLGLGLSIVSRLVEHHGGRLSIASSPGKGSQISLIFPRAKFGFRDELAQRPDIAVGHGHPAILPTTQLSQPEDDGEAMPLR